MRRKYMNKQFKKILSVTLALIVGFGIIFFAWKSTAPAGNKVSFEPAISGDSWKGSLLAVPQTSSIKNLEQNVAGAEATTTTDIIARELLVSYALAQQNMSTTTLSDAEAQALAQMLVEKIKLPQGVVYSTKNLVMSSDNSDSSFAAYAKRVGDIMQAFSTAHKTNELAIVANAITTKDEAELRGLAIIITEYRGLQKSLLAVSTPSLVAPLHLRLVQSYSNIEAAIIGMQKIISDPVIGLAAFTQYKKESNILRTINAEYQNYTSSQ